MQEIKNKIVGVKSIMSVITKNMNEIKSPIKGRNSYKVNTVMTTKSSYVFFINKTPKTKMVQN